MSFIISGEHDRAIQPIPPRGEVEGVDFFGSDKYFRIITNEGAELLYALNTPFCMNMITNHRTSQGFVVTQSILGRAGYQHFQKVLAGEREEFVIPLHKHDYYEFLYVLEGAVTHDIEHFCKRYCAGQACILNKNTCHSERFSENCSLIYFCFGEEYVRELYESQTIKKKSDIMYNFVLSNINKQSIFLKDYLLLTPQSGSSAQIATINQLLERMSSELLVKQPGQRLMINALLVRIMANFLDFSKAYDCRHIVLDTKSDSYLFNMITRWLEERSGKISRQSLSEKFGYSADHLNRVIKRGSGLSLIKYNQQICLKKAEHALRHTELNIADIIQKLGFDNQSHFYALFRDKHGMTPKQYRALFR